MFWALRGRCRWQELHYAAQLAVKEQMIASALATSGLPLPAVAPILPSPIPFFYRNKMEFSFGTDREGLLQLGLHVRGRFNWIFDVEECHRTVVHFQPHRRSGSSYQPSVGA